MSAPGSMERNSSRKVSTHEGSSPTIGVPRAIKGAAAASMRRASARASSTRPAARNVRPQHKGRLSPSGSQGHDAIAEADQHLHGIAQVLRLEVGVEGIREQRDFAVILADMHHRGRAVPLPLTGRG